MVRALTLLVFLGACSTAPPPPVFKADCPPPVPVPMAAPAHPTQAQKNALEVRVELGREAERVRGDACRAAVTERDTWINTWINRMGRQ